MPSILSEAAIRSLGVFGLTTDDARRNSADRYTRTNALAATLHRDLIPGGIALLTGPSASGKSSVLRELALIPGTISAEPCDGHPDRTVIDTLMPNASDLQAALRALSAAGLADAFLPSRPLHALSEGERARLAVACAIVRAESAPPAGRPLTILIDDFADALDDATAAAVIHAVCRWLHHHPGIRLIVASMRSGLSKMLRPDLTLAMRLDGSAAWMRHSGFTTSVRCEPLCISEAPPAAYGALAPFHYRSGKPATIARLLIARRAESDEPIGLLALSMPTLNGAWRRLAWPHLAGPASASPAAKRERAARLNAELRCISRLIVHPLHRARGVGAAMIRHYLAAPLTPRTEAVSAMGICSPVFSRAGMHAWTLPPAPRDLRLIDALSAADLRPWMLADIDLALERVEQFPHLDRALRTWANAHGPTRSLIAAPPNDLIRAAARHIIAPRHAYTSG